MTEPDCTESHLIALNLTCCAEWLLQVAHKLTLQCLVEVHTVAELERVLQLDILDKDCMLGINNRDLETFAVDLNNNKVIMESKAGREAVARGLIFAGESGISTPEDVKFVQVSFSTPYKHEFNTCISV